MSCCGNILPAEITAGLDFQAVFALPDYPAPDWTMTAVLRGPGQINLTATAVERGHQFKVLAADSATWQPGEYWWSIRASKTGSTVEVAKGQLTVLADLAAVSAPYDGRTQNQIALEAINAVLGKRATRDQERYTINNRELWRTPIADLLKLRAFYAVQVKRECQRLKGHATFGRAVAVRFSSK